MPGPQGRRPAEKSARTSATGRETDQGVSENHPELHVTGTNRDRLGPAVVAGTGAEPP